MQLYEDDAVGYGRSLVTNNDVSVSVVAKM